MWVGLDSCMLAWAETPIVQFRVICYVIWLLLNIKFVSLLSDVEVNIIERTLRVAVPTICELIPYTNIAGWGYNNN